MTKSNLLTLDLVEGFIHNLLSPSTFLLVGIGHQSAYSLMDIIITKWTTGEWDAYFSRY